MSLVEGFLELLDLVAGENGSVAAALGSVGLGSVGAETLDNAVRCGQANGRNNYMYCKSASERGARFSGSARLESARLESARIGRIQWGEGAVLGPFEGRYSASTRPEAANEPAEIVSSARAI